MIKKYYAHQAIMRLITFRKIN